MNGGRPPHHRRNGWRVASRNGIILCCSHMRVVAANDLAVVRAQVVLCGGRDHPVAGAMRHGLTPVGDASLTFPHTVTDSSTTAYGAEEGEERHSR